MDTDNQPFNFPYQYNTSVKIREIFTNYGAPSVVDVSKDEQIVSQKIKGDNFVRYSAVHPVLPLSCVAEKVKLPLEDRIMGHVIEKNKSLKKFCLRVQKFHSLGKRWGKTEQIKDILLGVDDFRTECETSDYLSDLCEQTAGAHMQPWFRDMLQDYMQLQGSIGLQFNNYQYAGGCLDSISVDDTHGYIASAAGYKFNHLRMTFVSQKTDGLLQSYIAEAVKLPNTIYGIKSRRVQGEDFVAVRTDRKCYLYKFNSESEERKLNMVNEPQCMPFQAVDISPYIAGECVLVDEAGKCYLWYGDSLEDTTALGEPRFQCNNWRHVQYGSHPRQLVYADQTAVQLFDLRMPSVKGCDLFSLPSKLLRNSERIQACSRHPSSVFYSVVATDYNLMLMDDRYSKYPVLKWEHMLSTPPQYMSSIDGTSANPDDNFIHVGSQYPTDVHAFRFSRRNGLPPLAVSQPHRAAKITDISKWPQFVDKCPNTDVLHNRLDTSLAGISTLPWQQGHVVFQLDSHGEIFHQVFSAIQSSADTTFSAGLGSHDLQILPVAVERAQTWTESWAEMMKNLLSAKIKTRENQASLLGMFHYRTPHDQCCVCQPELGYMPGGTEVTNPTAYCDTCMVLLKDGQNLLNSIREDKIVSCTSEHRLQGLMEVKDMPTDTALSKLLTKQWFGEKDSQNFDEILKDWDKEVLEKRKACKNQTGTDLPDMSEESVMRRILNIASGQSGSSPAHTATSAGNESWEPSIASSTDDLDGGFMLENLGNGSQKGQTSVVSQQKSVESVQPSKKRHKKDGERFAGSKESDMSSVRISTDAGSMKSVVFGSTDSAMSETFKITSQDKTSTGLPGFRSLLTQSQEHMNASPSRSRNQDQTGENKESVPTFLSPLPVTNTSSRASVHSTSLSLGSGKKKHKKNAKRKSSAGSTYSVETVSEISLNSLNVGSEDLFDDNLQTVELATDDDRLSSVLSVAGCEGLLNSQMSNHVSEQILSSQKSGDKTLDKIQSSPRKGGVGISPRKVMKRKLVAGF